MPAHSKDKLPLKVSDYKLPAISDVFTPIRHTPFDTFNDQDLWNEFKKGNRSAFVYIYNRYFDEMYLYGLQFTQDLDLLKDSIQDVFVRLNDSRKRLSTTSSIKYYLYKSIKREIIHAQKRQKQTVKKLQSMQGLGFEYEISAEEIIISRQIKEDLATSIREAANSLLHRQREIIFYHFFEGFSIKQIQELMGFSSVQATHNLLNRAIKKLRDMLVLIAFLFFMG